MKQYNLRSRNQVGAPRRRARSGFLSSARAFPIGLALLATLTAFATPSTAAAAEVPPEAPISYGAEFDVNSRYIWHGIPFSEGAVVQPSVWLARSGLTFTVWANSPLSDPPFLSRWDEIDLTLSYEKQSGKLIIEPSFNYYLYPAGQASPATGELAVKFSYPFRGNLSAFTTHTFDVVQYGGSYFGEAGLEYGGALGPRASWGSCIGLGWGSRRFNQTYIGPEKGALNVAVIDLSLTYHLSKNAYLRPHVAFSCLLDRSLRHVVADPDNLIVGLAAGFEF